ncbi:MAG: hypothetical protein KIS90_13335, partial [Phenylobacterium sp.]|nr:hypothetical protein [Phenylobacterium sp.]
FHGYLLHITHQAVGGHLEMQRVIESPYIDFLSSPFSYEFDSRFLGGSGHYRCLWESLRLRGKLWLNENDHPTHVGDIFGRPGPFWPTTVEGDIAAMRRNTAHCYTLGQGMWWFDFGPHRSEGGGRWWAHPALKEETGRLLKLTEALLDETETSLPAAHKVLEVITNSALRMTPGHLEELAQVARDGDVEAVRRALFDLVAQVRGEKPAAPPSLRVVTGG